MGRTYSIARRRASHPQSRGAGDDDSPKHDEAWRHRDEFAEDASPPREEYGKVELEKGFFHKEQRLNLNVMRDDRRFAFA